MNTPVLLERDESVAVVTLNRPDALNSFDDALRRGLKEAIQEVATQDEVRVVVLTGAGRCFSAGADLRVVDRLDAELVRGQLGEDYGPTLSLLGTMAKPVIAAVNGPAVGIGLAFALCCDLLVIEEGAYLQAPFARLGLIPDGGLTWLLPRLLGYPRSFEFAAEGTRIEARRALELGLVNRITAAGGAKREALEWAQSLAACAPLALAATKRAMRRNLERGYAAAFELEAEEQSRVAASEDCAEGVTAFREKRPPLFRGR